MNQQNSSSNGNNNSQQQQQHQQHQYESQAARVSRVARRKELENALKNPKSLISVDGLLDGITALVLDCEPMRKNKNIENFLNRCKNQQIAK